MLDKLRNLGDFNHNIEVLRSQKGLLIVGRRSPGHDPYSYLPCKYCMVFYMGENLWRHARHCNQRKAEDDQIDEEMTNTFKLEGRMILSGAGLYDGTETEHEFRKYVLEGMYQDEVRSQIRKDPLLIKFGSTLYNKLGKERTQDIRGRLRNTARMLIELNRQKPENSKKCMSDYIHPCEFDSVVAAVKKLCCLTDEERTLSGQSTFKKPSLVLKLGENLKKLAYLKRGRAIREQSKAMQDEVNEYLSLHESEWCDTLASKARATLQERTFNKPEVIPLTQDLVKLKNSIVDDMNHYKKAFTDDPEGSYNDLAGTTLARILLFNKQRQGKPGKLRISQYTVKPNYVPEESELFQSLTPIEQKLVQNLHLVEVFGKRGRKVPMLITPDVKESIDMLLQKREECHVLKDNPFVFALQRSSESRLRGNRCLHTAVRKASLEKPEMITSTSLRKYVATVSQASTFFCKLKF